MIQITIPRIAFAGVAALAISTPSWAEGSGETVPEYSSEVADVATTEVTEETAEARSGGGRGGGGGKVGGGNRGGGNHGGGNVGGGNRGGGNHGGGNVGGGNRGGGNHGGGHVGGGNRGGGNHGGGHVGGGNRGGGNHGGGHVGGGNRGGGNHGGGHVGGGNRGGGNHGGGHVGGGNRGGGNHGGGHVGGGNRGGGRHGGTPGGGGRRGSGWNPQNPIVKRDPARTQVFKVPSHRLNPNTAKNLNGAFQRAKGLTRSPQMNQRLRHWQDHFKATYHGGYQAKWNHCGGYYHDIHYRYYYSGWYSHGFCGGFYYPVRPWWDIQVYFVYPVVYWMYVDYDVNVDQPMFSDWYASAPACEITPFEYRRAYFPTDTMKDLGVDVSALSSTMQCNFMTAMRVVTGSLGDQIADMLAASFDFADNDIVVTHYENLQNQVFVLEGFVDRDNVKVSFKATLDLNHPETSVMFVPTSQDPTADDLNRLDDMNKTIRGAGGDPDNVSVEPVDVPAPEAM